MRPFADEGPMPLFKLVCMKGFFGLSNSAVQRIGRHMNTEADASRISAICSRARSRLRWGPRRLVGQPPIHRIVWDPMWDVHLPASDRFVEMPLSSEPPSWI